MKIKVLNVFNRVVRLRKNFHGDSQKIEFIFADFRCTSVHGGIKFTRISLL